MKHPSVPTPPLPPEAERWLQQHPEADRAALEQAWRLAGLAGEATPAFVPDPDRVDQMEARLAAFTQGHRQDRPPVRAKRRPATGGWRIAAVVAVLAVVGGLLWLQPTGVEAPAGERVAVVLPDGSQIELNSGSRLSYRRTFGWRIRSVRLRGEAFFDVETGTKPFLVETFNSRVTVLGTRFNVRAWAEDYTPATVVALEDGQVRLAAEAAPEQAVVLAPGQMSRVDAGRADPTPPVAAAIAEALIWRQGGLRFTDAPLGDILDELGRRTGTRITVADSALRDLRATLDLKQVQDATAVLSILSEVRGLQYRATEAGYVLSARPQP